MKGERAIEMKSARRAMGTVNRRTGHDAKFQGVPGQCSSSGWIGQAPGRLLASWGGAATAQLAA